MSDQPEQDFERRLAGLVPAEPAGSIVDAAYEAGRRDAMAERSASPFRVFRVAAVVVVSMGLAGVGGFVAWRGERSPGLAAQPMASSTQREPERAVAAEREPEAPAPKPQPPLLASASLPEPPRQTFGSPFSVLSLRSAVLTPEGVKLDRLPESRGSGGGEDRIPTPRMTSTRIGDVDL